MNKLLLIAFLFSAGCATSTAVQAPAAVQPVPQKPKVTFDDIFRIAENSKCTSYNWKNRGVGPKAYTKGVSLVFAKSLCRQNDTDIKILSSAQSGDDVKDSLSLYNSTFKALGMTNDKSGVDTLRHTYTLLIGLGMMESAGKHCCGRDMSANFSSADSAEAGLFQASWGARRSSPVLAPMIAKYKVSKAGCFLDVFQDKVKCKPGNEKNWGEGDGAIYQQTAKECPAFATEYAAVLLRTLGGTKGEFGPLRKKAAEINPDCDGMFKQVQTLVEQNPDICSQLK